MIEMADVNNDGALGFHEFCQLMDTNGPDEDRGSVEDQMQAEAALKALIEKYSRRPKVSFNEEDLTKIADMIPTVDLKDLQMGARFRRTIWMMIPQAMYFPIVQATLPIIKCTPYTTEQRWFFEEQEWREAADHVETKNYLEADLQEKCTGTRYYIGYAIAWVMLAGCIFVPIWVLWTIERDFKLDKATAKDKAAALRVSIGQAPNHKPAPTPTHMSYFAKYFVEGTPPDPVATKMEMALFEERLLRDQFSGLYAMCKPNAYYWFAVDLGRKALVTVIYTFGKNGAYNCEYIHKQSPPQCEFRGYL